MTKGSAAVRHAWDVAVLLAMGLAYVVLLTLGTVGRAVYRRLRSIVAVPGRVRQRVTGPSEPAAETPTGAGDPPAR
ncbi:hypothetical protein [Halomicrobium salinisoli]|uniref:hypothetical protein n=1 Tax=Halomicrobium salinisoli TaxID=2878391 RepID=UPI001CF04587|nr:hypothetical protein [Halomicrobium salinisoli]